MSEKKEKLFSEFPPVTTAEWEALIEKDLKGADYDKKLVWKTGQGFNARPYYREDDLQGIETGFLPGEYPYVRGNRLNNNDWFIRQNIRVHNIEEANKKALEILGKGVTSLGFCFDCCKEITKEDLSVLLKKPLFRKEYKKII
mgnify:CR=1 FL=1